MKPVLYFIFSRKRVFFYQYEHVHIFDSSNANHIRLSFDNVTRKKKNYHELLNVLLNLVPNHPWQLKLCMIILVNIL